mmetsp:Transcript_14587/g.33727  ORF Transcript_14587/g.33727 Transcript_14587/m.33727 type:complete len:143 (+) Transcript_14587:429-857(+)
MRHPSNGIESVYPVSLYFWGVPLWDLQLVDGQIKKAISLCGVWFLSSGRYRVVSALQGVLHVYQRQCVPNTQLLQRQIQEQLPRLSRRYVFLASESPGFALWPCDSRTLLSQACGLRLSLSHLQENRGVTTIHGRGLGGTGT